MLPGRMAEVNWPSSPKVAPSIVTCLHTLVIGGYTSRSSLIKPRSLCTVLRPSVTRSLRLHSSPTYAAAYTHTGFVPVSALNYSAQSVPIPGLLHYQVLYYPNFPSPALWHYISGHFFSFQTPPTSDQIVSLLSSPPQFINSSTPLKDY